MTKQVFLKHYTWGEWCDQAAKPHKLGSSGRPPGKSEWGMDYGVPLVNALSMARGAGAQELIPEAEAFAQRIEAEVELTTGQTTFHATYDVCGAEVDMSRFLSGEPECMIQAEPYQVARKGRAVRIVVPGAYQSGTDPQAVLHRGAAVVALCQVLARAQHPVEVWVGFCNHVHKGRTSYMVRVQEADQPLDEGRLMFALARIESNRRMCFSVKETEANGIGTDGGGYGSAPREVKLEDLPDDQANTIIVEDFDTRSSWSVEQAVAWLNATLADLF